MNNGYNETRGNGTKWSCQNQIKSKSKSNQKSNPKQDFKLKSVSNAFSGYLRVNLVNVIFSVSKMNSLLQEKSTTNRFVICSTCERCLLVFYSLLVQDTSVYPPKI